MNCAFEESYNRADDRKRRGNDNRSQLIEPRVYVIEADIDTAAQIS